MLKLPPHSLYPVENGRFLRGNDYSPVALAVVLNTDADKIPKEIIALVKLGVESGAALSGTVQTPNIGFEKMICNIIANPNIRYLILAGPESPGHLTGEALNLLFKNGIDEKRKIIGTEARQAYLYNIPIPYIERFKRQVSLINLQFKEDKDIGKAIYACIQETPTDFNGITLYDMGAFPEPLLDPESVFEREKPWLPPAGKDEQAAIRKMHELIERIKKKNDRLKQ